MNIIKANSGVEVDLILLAGLALKKDKEDVRTFVGMLVRKYKNTNPDLHAQLKELLKTEMVGKSNVLRGKVS